MKKRKGGFTLVEIIVSLALVAIIAVGIIPAFAAQLKLTIQTKEITAQTFDAQAELENVIHTLKEALVTPAADDETAIAGVSAVTKSIFGTGRDVTLYRLIKDFPYNADKNFQVFLSKKLAEMEVRQLLVAEGVTIEVSDETIHKVADLKKTPQPTLIGKCSTNTDPNFYTNIFKWYVSKEGDPDPLFPEDYQQILPGNTSTLGDLTQLANRYIVFTVTPVDIHGVRGNEVRSNNTVYVLGEEWRAGAFAWVDKNANASYAAETDVKVAKSTFWPLVRGFDSSPFPDPDNPEAEDWLDPSNGSLYVPMNIDRLLGERVGPIEVNGADFVKWTVDKSINLATDIIVNNNTDVEMKTLDGNIVLYQYIAMENNDAVFEADGMPRMVNYGPEVSVPYGKILFHTGGQGDVILQNYTELGAGSDITLSPYGHVSAFKSTLSAGGSITLDSTKGGSYLGNREIVVRDTALTLKHNSVADRFISITSRDLLTVSDTVFTGNAGAASSVKLSAPNGISLADTEFLNSAIRLDSDTTMTGGGWSNNSAITVADNKWLMLGAAGSKVANSGALILGNTGGVSFVSNMATDLANPLSIILGQGDHNDEVVISTTYGRNVGYADSSGADNVGSPGEYQNLGSGQTNLRFTAEKESGYGSPDVRYSFDGENKITISADGDGIEPISALYSLKVADRYAEGVAGEIFFRVTASAGEEPTVNVIGTTMPTFTVTFDRNGGTVDAQPPAMQVGEGLAVGTLPQPPVLPGHNFIGWNTTPDGSGTEFNGATVVTSDMAVYAQYTLIPVFTVTFDKNGGATDADPAFMVVEQGKSIGALPVPPTRPGYQFLTWSSLANGGSLINEQTVVLNNMTAYAQWTVKKAFTSITTGEYVKINNVLFQKITSNQLLARNSITTGPPNNYNTMNWSTANSLAVNFYLSLGTEWVTNNSGLVAGSTLNNLDTYTYRNAILDVDYSWWGGSYNYGNAYYVNSNGSVNTRDKDDDIRCRPYITVDTNNLYISSGTGTATDPYILMKE